MTHLRRAWLMCREAAMVVAVFACCMAALVVLCLTWINKDEEYHVRN